MNTAPYGFRIVGACTEPRRLINWVAAFTGFATLDARAETNREGYLSAFTFGDDFRQYLDATGSTKDFDGACWSPWLWFDLDREGDLDAARRDAARLALSLVERFGVDEDDLLLFFSGSKGFHAGLPTAIWQPEPSLTFNRTARRFAEALATAAGVTIDTGVYDKVRPFRSPNSRHPKTGLHKLRLSLDELTGLSVAAILERATMPALFDIPTPTRCCDRAAADWQAAAELVEREAAAAAQRRATNNGTTKLNRATFDFIRDGAGTGDRHRLLFSAAANLAEFGCPPALAHALLTEAALDAGLRPRDVHREIECGMAHKPKAGTLFADDASASTEGGYYVAGL